MITKNFNKVTFDELDNLLYRFYVARSKWEKHCLEHECNGFLLYGNLSKSANPECEVKSSLDEDMGLIYNNIKQKLEYLVSLQEK